MGIELSVVGIAALEDYVAAAKKQLGREIREMEEGDAVLSTIKALCEEWLEKGDCTLFSPLISHLLQQPWHIIYQHADDTSTPLEDIDTIVGAFRTFNSAESTEREEEIDSLFREMVYIVLESLLPFIRICYPPLLAEARERIEKMTGELTVTT